MADLPINSSDAQPVNITDPTVQTQIAGVTTSSSLKTDFTTIDGSAVSIAATGIQKVGLTDGSGNSINSTSNALNTTDAADGPSSPGTSASKAILIAGQYNVTPIVISSGQQAAVQLDVDGRTLIAGGFNNSSFNFGGNSSVTYTQVIGYSNAVIAISGTWTATVTFNASIDGGSTYFPIAAASLSNPNLTPSSSTTVNGLYYIPVPAYNALQIVVSSYVSGTVQTVISFHTFGTTPIDPDLVNGQYNSSLPTLTTGQQGPIQVDSFGRLLIGSIANALPSGSNTIGAVTQESGPWTINLTQVDGTALGAPSIYGTSPGSVNVIGVNSFITNSPTVNQGTANATPWNENIADVGGVDVAATAKGTQGTNFINVQEAKDSGRSYVTFTADAVAGVTSETLLTVTQNTQGSTTSATTYTIPNGKTLRIQNIALSVQSASATGEWTRVKLRHNTTGATTTSSALVTTIEAGTANAVTATTGTHNIAIPDGLEFYGNGTQTIGLTHISSATTNVESVTVVGYLY